MKRVLLVGHAEKPDVREMIDRVAPWLRRHCEIAGIHLDAERPVGKVACDFVFVFGGDGTMLWAARNMAELTAPVVGVNLGRMGFLTHVGPEAFEEQITRILAGEGTVSERLMLECRVRTAEGRTSGPFVALNDVVIARGGRSLAVDFTIWIDGEPVTEYQGDGLIVATPTGSTGYNLSAGGPVVSPNIQALIVTPISPHSLTNRPLVIGPGETVEVRMPTSPERIREVLLTTDGQFRESLHAGGIVEVQRSERTFRMIELGTHAHYENLRDKLHWGQSVKLRN